MKEFSLFQQTVGIIKALLLASHFFPTINVELKFENSFFRFILSFSVDFTSKRNFFRKVNKYFVSIFLLSLLHRRHFILQIKTTKFTAKDSLITRFLEIGFYTELERGNIKFSSMFFLLPSIVSVAVTYTQS